MQQSLLASYFWTVVSKWIVRFLGIISTLILVRTLTPTDFGIAAQSMMVVMLFDALSQTGGDRYIIKLKQVTQAQLMTTWTLNLLLRSVITVLIYTYSDLLARWVGEPSLTSVLHVSCLVLLLGSLVSPHFVLLRKEMNFKGISQLNVIAKFISFVVTLSLLFWYKNYWVLIWGNIVGALILLVGSYVLAPVFPKFTLSHFTEQWHFSKNILFMAVIGYLRSKVDIFAVSHLFGSAAVGKYSVAQEYSQLPQNEVVQPISAPLYSTIAKFSDNNEILKDKAFKYLSVVYLFIFPCITGIHLLANDIVFIVFGEQWSDAAPILANLSLLMIAFSTYGIFQNIFILQNKFKSFIAIDFLGFVLIVAAIFIKEISTPEIFSQYRILVALLVIIVTFGVAKKLLHFKIKHIWIVAFIPTIASTIMYSALYLIQYLGDLPPHSLLTLLMSILLGAIIYILISISMLILLKNKHQYWHFNFSLVAKAVNSLKELLNKLNVK